jgi:hypothetical protein
MVYFVFFIFSLFTFHVLRMFCRIRTFSSIGWSYDENFLHLYFISHNSNWGGYKGIPPLHISVWLGINFLWYTSYLFWWAIETIFHRHSLEKPSSSKLFHFAVLKGFVEAIFNRYPSEMVLEYYLKLKFKRYFFNKLYWSFINNFIRKSGQWNLYSRVSKLFYSLPSLTKRKRKKGIDGDCIAAYIS